MRTIYKFPLEITDGQTVVMPKGAEILTAQFQHNVLCLWAIVDVGNDTQHKDRVIEIFGSALIWICLLVSLAPLAIWLNVYRSNLLQDTKFSRSGFPKCVVSNHPAAANLDIALCPSLVIFAGKFWRSNPMLSVSVGANESYPKWLLASDFQSRIGYVCNNLRKSVNPNIIRRRISKVFDAQVKSNHAPLFSGRKLVHDFHIALRNTHIRALGMFGLFFHRTPLGIHYIPLFSVDKNLSNNSQSDDEVQQVCGKELRSFSQVRPANGSNEQTNDSNPATNKNPSQVTGFAVAMTVIGLAGIVIGIVLFYHYFNLYLDSDTYKGCVLILSVCLECVFLGTIQKEELKTLPTSPAIIKQSLSANKHLHRTAVNVVKHFLVNQDRINVLSGLIGSCWQKVRCIRIVGRGELWGRFGFNSYDRWDSDVPSRSTPPIKKRNFDYRVLTDYQWLKPDVLHADVAVQVSIVNDFRGQEGNA